MLLSLSSVANLSLLVGVCAACMLAYRCLGVQPRWLSPFHRRKHCQCAHTSPPANFQCSHYVVLPPFCIIYSLHWSPFDFCKPFGYQNDPCNCHHFSLFFCPRDAQIVQIFPQEALRWFCRNVMFTIYVPYAGCWYCLALPWPAHMISRMFCHQSKCSDAKPSPCFDTIPHIVACLCSPLCRHLYTTFHIVAWVCSFVSKHL